MYSDMSKEIRSKVWDLVYFDRYIQMEYISTILQYLFGLCKLTAHWVLKSHINVQMATRASVSSRMLKWFRLKGDNFLLC